MKIATWNVNGIRARQGELQDLLDREQPDVLCVQEIKASPDQLPVWLIDIEGYYSYWHGGQGLLRRGDAGAQGAVARPIPVSPPHLRLRAPHRDGATCPA